MLSYNDMISIFENYLKISNIGIGKFAGVKINIQLNYSLVNNT